MAPIPEPEPGQDFHLPPLTVEDMEAARKIAAGNSGSYRHPIEAAGEDGPQAMDTRTPEQRRRIMQAVGSKHTGPELVVRRLLHRMGYRYRLHRRDLPGRPDIAFISRRKAIFVHGCFWHGHDCPKGRLPKSRLVPADRLDPKAVRDYRD